MADDPTPQKPPQPRSFWATLPGIFTAVGGLIAAVATLITALASVGVFSPKATATPVVADVTQTAAPTQSPLATAAPAELPGTASTEPLPSATPSDLLADGFADPRSGWPVSVTEKAELGYEQGEYRISVYETEYAAWGEPEPAVDLGDFVIEVDARRVDGPAENEYGILVRYQPDDTFYYFAVSSLGQFSVQKYTGEHWQLLVDWTPSAAVREDEATNHLRVTCQGARMRFFVNGSPLTQVEDASFARGSIGLLASSADTGGVVIGFDNLRVRPLSD